MGRQCCELGDEDEDYLPPKEPRLLCLTAIPFAKDGDSLQNLLTRAMSEFPKSEEELLDIFQSYINEGYFRIYLDVDQADRTIDEVRPYLHPSPEDDYVYIWLEVTPKGLNYYSHHYGDYHASER